ncbi:MAG: cobaltochelatase subunit CobN, partial [Candidatus Methanomethylophilaceae archaeon]|nr:cobaltochelatase subunit CobN [Candidatus Methanomethylophilaceae archaeon]
MFRIVSVIIGISDSESMKKTVKTVSEKEKVGITIDCFDAGDTESDPLLFKEMCSRAEEADLVIVRCRNDPDRFSKMEKFSRCLEKSEGYVYVHSSDSGVRDSRRYLFRGSDEDFARLSAYVGNRGEENDESLVYWLLNRKGMDVPVPEPVSPRPHGIYHPDFPRDIAAEDYFRRMDPDKPAAGVLITGSYWIYDNLEHIDALIRSLESAGMETIPVFFNSGSREGKLPMRDIFKEYFTDGDRSRVKAIITTNPFSQLAGSGASGGVNVREEDNFYHTLTGVPVFQAVMISGKYSDYQEKNVSGDKTRFTTQTAWAEMDGQIITVPVSEVLDLPGKGKINYPLRDRIENLTKTVSRWVGLGMKPPEDRKIAIILYQYGGKGTIGSAAGLDGTESAACLLKALKNAGYTAGDVPETGRSLADMLMAGVTNDPENMSDGEIEKNAPGLVSPGEYSRYYGSLSEYSRAKTEECWGKPMGEIMTTRGKAVIPGIVFGNILVTVQPVRSWPDQADRMCHDPELYPPHQYLAFYRWLSEDFGADAVIHMGTHGTLEWLPGRSAGLSSKCCPSYVQDGLANIYPYLIDDPGEGIQAKRRSEAVLIGHMCPLMTRSGAYDELGEIDAALQEYFGLDPSGPADRKASVLERIRELCRSVSLSGDLGFSDDEIGDHLPEIHDYIMDVKDSLVRDGIHVLGRNPEGEKLDECVYSLTRIRNGSIPSFRDSVRECLDPGGKDPSAFLDEADETAYGLIKKFRSSGYDVDKCLSGAERQLGKLTDNLTAAIGFICRELVPRLRRTADEISNILIALDGKYVLPGPSGAPTRGRADILPTGRNYYSIDPDCIPSRSAWETGIKAADGFIERFKEEKGAYPREIGFVLWATDTMKTGGDDVAYILWLLGVRPVRTEGGDAVTGLEAVPLKELGRPRVDVTVRITGLFRDTFPNLIDLIDDAVCLVAGLDEDDESNALAANLRRDMVISISGGLAEDEARRRASIRIFGSPPGSYGSGMNHAVDTGEWKTAKDLADMYVSWGSYAYGRGIGGVQMRDEFFRNFGRSEATVKNMPDREIDLTDVDDVYGYLGGLNAFVKTYGKKDALSFIGDSSDPDNVSIRGTAE